MSKEMIHVAMIFVATYGFASGALHGVAAVIQAWFKGKAILIRAERGDPELRSDSTPMPRILGSFLRNRQDGGRHSET